MTASVRALHLLNRAAFGPRPGDIDRLTQMSVDRYLGEQLQPGGPPLPDALVARLNSLSTLRLDPVTLFDTYERPVVQARGDPEAQKEARRRAQIIVQQATEARLVRALWSPWQLHEMMTAFWFNHFNIFAGKGLVRLWVGHYEEYAIRPHVLGRFRALLEATATHPAMLFYLDNWQNTGPGTPGKRGKFQGLNENYARELLELHTLGVDGGYTQHDVTELARVLTGWGLARPAGPRDRTLPARGGPGAQPGFFFDARRHDGGDKLVLGETIRGRGIGEGEHVLDALSRHPSTAHHIAYKLAQWFVTDEPPGGLVKRLTDRFLETDGDIRALVRTLFASEEFWNEHALGSKFKTPYEYVISAVRAVGADVQNIAPLLGVMAQLGMPVYGCLTPDGYKSVQDAWLNPEAMMRRLSFATALGAGRLPLAQRPAGSMEPADAARLSATLGDSLRPETMAAVEAAPAGLRAAMILGSPDFMMR